MFRALVIGGSVSAAGCGPKSATQPAAAEATPVSTEAEPDDAVACEEICEYSSSGNICPDPVEGGENCCWLMQTPHPCCDVQPAGEPLGGLEE